MDLQKLEADLGELEKKFRERNGTYWQLSQETAQKIGHDGYTAEDRERELEALEPQLDAIYEPLNSIRPLLDEVITAYAGLSSEERTELRAIFQRSNCGSDGLHYYIFVCAANLKRPEDGAIFRNGLIAASIQNCAHDFGIQVPL